MAPPAVLRINIISNARGAVSGIREADGALGKLGKGAAIAGAGLVAAGGAAVAIGVALYKSASQAEQAAGALDSVFGKSAARVKAWAATAANDVGLASTKYSELASLLGSQLTNMGRSQAEAAVESKKLIATGADLAATFGGSVADAVAAVSSTLKGETDPIERYGISIKAADISARLASQGLDKLKGAALKQATATAALELITKQSTAAHGAFGREANTAAGQQERLSATVENLKTKMGAGLLPVATATFGFLNRQALPAVSRLSASLGERLGPALSSVGRFIRSDVVPAARSFIAWFSEKIVPAIRGTVTPVINGLRSMFAKVAERLEANSGSLSKLGGFLKRVAELAAKLAPILGKILGKELQFVGSIIGAVVDGIGALVSVFDAAWQGAKRLADILETLSSPLKAVGGLIGKLNPFGAGALVGGAAALAGASPAFGPRGLTTAAAGAGGFIGGAAASSGAVVALPAYVDARTYHLTVNGALDPVASARAVREMLRVDDIRAGRVPGFAPMVGAT